MATGEFAHGKEHLEKALARSAEWVGDHDVYAMLADTAVQQRDLVALLEFTPLAEEAATRYNHVLYQAISHRAWGVTHRLTGEFDEAELRLKQSLEYFQNLQTPWQEGRTHRELAKLALARSDTVTALSELSLALSLFNKLGAKPDIEQTKFAIKNIE